MTPRCSELAATARTSRKSCYPEPTSDRSKPGIAGSEEAPSPPSDGGEGRGEEGRWVRMPHSCVAGRGRKSPFQKSAGKNNTLTDSNPGGERSRNGQAPVPGRSSGWVQ